MENFDTKTDYAFSNPRLQKHLMFSNCTEFVMYYVYDLHV